MVFYDLDVRMLNDANTVAKRTKLDAHKGHTVNTNTNGNRTQMNEHGRDLYATETPIKNISTLEKQLSVIGVRIVSSFTPNNSPDESNGPHSTYLFHRNKQACINLIN